MTPDDPEKPPTMPQEPLEQGGQGVDDPPAPQQPGGLVRSRKPRTREELDRDFGPDYKPPRENGRFVKGWTGNPYGAPRRKPFTDAIMEIVDKEGALKVIKPAWEKAKKGSHDHLRLIVERIEGKVPNLEEGEGQPNVPTVEHIERLFAAAGLKVTVEIERKKP